jgi:iron complex transport system substrate-binding protein
MRRSQLPMKKSALLFIAMVMALVFLFGACSQASSTPGTTATEMTVADTLGRAVTVPADAQKFIAIGPGALRLYCYVGDVRKIVGVEQTEVTDGVTGRPYAMANPELLELPIIGPGGSGATPDAEKILDVGPDVIFSLYNSDISAVDELESKTHIPVVVLSYGKSEVFDPAVDQSLELIGKITGNEQRAADVVQFFAACQADLASRTGDIPLADKPTVYLGAESMRGTHGIESTSGSYSLFTADNVRNVVDEAGIDQYVMLDKEKLLDMDPDIIFLDGGGLANVQEDYNTTPQFYQGLSAFKNGNVYLQLPYNYYYTNIDIALCDAYYIGKVVYPDRFSDVDIVTKSNEIFKELLGKELYAQIADGYYGGFQKLSFK